MRARTAPGAVQQGAVRARPLRTQAPRPARIKTANELRAWVCVIVFDDNPHAPAHRKVQTDERVVRLGLVLTWQVVTQLLRLAGKKGRSRCGARVAIARRRSCRLSPVVSTWP